MNHHHLLVAALREVLRQGEILLNSLDDARYSHKLPVAYGASIGGHYRHCLDHFLSLFESLESGEVNYDCRRRDLRIETERAYALAATRRLLRASEDLRAEALGQPVLAMCRVSYEAAGLPAAASSTLARETMYTVAHAVHHYALIGVMCRLQDVPLPEGFGVAPSTIEHQKHQAAAAAA